MQIKETKFRKQKNVMQVISKARNAVVKAKKKTLEMFSKKIKVDLSHAIRISLSVDLFGRTYQCREIVILLYTSNPKPNKHDKVDNVHTI